jgi:uncharacterized membrane protein
VRSKAAVGTHPLHPAIVPVPIGCFFVSVVADVVYAGAHNPTWYAIAFYTMLIGVISALVAALFGFIDYFGVRMSAAGRRVATLHMVLNLGVVIGYLVNVWLRWGNEPLVAGRWNLAFGLQLLSFAALGVSGWLGGDLAYKHKVGVVEGADDEATAIGRAEPTQGRVATERSGAGRSRPG